MWSGGLHRRTATHWKEHIGADDCDLPQPLDLAGECEGQTVATAGLGDTPSVPPSPGRSALVYQSRPPKPQGIGGMTQSFRRLVTCGESVDSQAQAGQNSQCL
jgi:hypothetical protein